jgi:cell division septal protein FtsQ
MFKRGFDGFLQDFLKIVLTITFLIAILKAQSVLYVIPFLNIKNVVVDTQNKRLSEAVNRVINEDFHGNYLLLTLNKAKFEKALKKLTQDFVKEVSLKDFEWLKGTLKISVKTRKPLFLLNNEFFVDNNGVLFGFLNDKTLPKIFDYRTGWNYGEVYKLFNFQKLEKFSQKYGIALIRVSKNGIEMSGDKVFLNLPSDKISLEVTESYLDGIKNNVGTKGKIVLSLYGDKTYAFKTLKE